MPVRCDAHVLETWICPDSYSLSGKAQNLLSELGVGQQLLHHGPLPVLLGDSGMIEVHWVVHNSTHLKQIYKVCYPLQEM